MQMGARAIADDETSLAAPPCLTRRAKARSRAACAFYGIYSRERHTRNAGDHLRGRRAAAQIGALTRRISADHEKIVGRLDTKMAGPGRQDGNIPRPDGDLAAPGPTEHQTGMAG